LNLEATLSKLYNVYMYPARFPSKIFDLFFSKLEVRGVIFDPFAGSGSLALASYLKCYDSEVWDLNPVIHVIVDASVNVVRGYSVGEALRLLEDALRYGRGWLPSDAGYWWPEQVLDIIISRVWGFFRDNMASFNDSKLAFEPYDERWSLYAVIALYASRRLSYTDDSVPKWFKSRYKVGKLTSLLSVNDVRELFWRYARLKAVRIARVQESLVKPNCEPDVEVKVVDVVTASKYPDGVAGALTSPPYVQAQEYIRSFSGELKLLGVPDSTISRLRSLEIPYRPPINLNVESPTYQELLEGLEPRYRKLLESYFTNTLQVLERTAENMMEKAILGVFAGEATVRGRPVPIIKVVREHLTRKLNLREVEGGIIEDRIRRRRLFKKRKNMNPNGIQVEHLTLLRKEPVKR
jgi:hypothetical protein